MTDRNEDSSARPHDSPDLDPGAITPAVPDEFGLVQVWWGDGKGKTTAALGMGFRAAGHGFRVHLLQFMKGGTGTVEDVRGEYAAIEAVPGFTYEHSGSYGWHGFGDETDDEDHTERARAGFGRASEIVAGTRAADLSTPFPADGDPTDGVHMLVLDELLYAANRGLVDPAEVVDLVADRPPGLELVLTGGHDRPEYLLDNADLVSQVAKERHPVETGQGARKGTEF